MVWIKTSLNRPSHTDIKSEIHIPHFGNICIVEPLWSFTNLWNWCIMGRNYMNARNMKWKCACSQMRNVPNHAHCVWVYRRNLHAHRMGMKTHTHECRAMMWNHTYTKPITNTFMYRNIWRSWTKWLLKMSNPCQKLKTCNNSSQNAPTSQIMKSVPFFFKLWHTHTWNKKQASP